VIKDYVRKDGYRISRLIKGGWHLAGGHGTINEQEALADMAAFVAAGIHTFDCADIYTGVEALIGRFRRHYTSLAEQVQIHTKYVPDLDRLATITPIDVQRSIDRSLDRLGCERLDLVQFHWWDYAVPGYVEVALVLDRLRQQGKIARVGVTNFDTERLTQIVEAGVQVSAHQLQYSLLDDRPAHAMLQFCARHDIAVLCYGTVAGGFLSDRWLGLPPPEGPLDNRSLVKYRLIIDEFGGWAAFQSLLTVLRAVADRHGVDVATVATGAILHRQNVAAAIVGATSRRHLPAHLKLSCLCLTPADVAEIASVTAQRLGPIGDVYTLERDRNGPHGRIMKYDLGDSTEKKY
jgi:hypothetical protein